MTTITESRRPFVPGMGVDWLLPLYDPFTRLLGLDSKRRDLVLQAALRPGHRLLDIGCGTGSLAVLIKRLFADVEVVGVDPDVKALARATRKARRGAVNVQFDLGFADALSYPDESFDRVFSSFMFHHLERDEKVRTLREVRRVLKADGSLHLLDFGGSAGHGPGLPANHRLADNDEGTIIGLLNQAAFGEATKVGERSLLSFARIAYYRAARLR